MWTKEWLERIVCIHSDNMAVVQALNNLCINKEFLGGVFHNILMILAQYSIHLQTVHIPGIGNRQANTLSRLLTGHLGNNWVLEKVTIEGT